MNHALTPALRQHLQQQLRARREVLDAQRTAHLAGQSRAAHAAGLVKDQIKIDAG